MYEISEAKLALIDAEESLRLAKKAYRISLESNDLVSQVAFLLFQRDVLSEPDWKGPVTWEDWIDLTIESERDEWRELAANIIELIEEHNGV